MKKSLNRFLQLPASLLTLALCTSAMAGLPIGVPAPGTSWTITYQEPGSSSSARVRAVSPEHAAALALHQRMAPKLVRSEAHRIGNEFIREDIYANNLRLQTFINPKMFIEEQRSGDEILANSRVLYEVLEGNTTFLFFPELAQFDRAEPQGEIREGEFKGMLKFLLKSTELENERKMVANYMREQGYETDIDQEISPDQYVVVNPETKLPVAFFNGTTTAVYKFFSTKTQPQLSPAVLKLKARLENP